jgi:hypothetical protein
MGCEAFGKVVTIPKVGESGTDGHRLLSHQCWSIFSSRTGSCISGFKYVCQRTKAFTCSLLPLQGLWHLPSTYRLLSFQVPMVRTGIPRSRHMNTIVDSLCARLELVER